MTFVEKGSNEAAASILLSQWRTSTSCFLEYFWGLVRLKIPADKLLERTSLWLRSGDAEFLQPVFVKEES